MLLLVISLLKMSLEYSAEVLSTVPKRKEAVMCLMEKVCVFDKLHSGICCSSVGHEFNVNETINVYHINRINVYHIL